MSHELKSVPKQLDKTSSPEINRDQIKLVGDKAFVSVNVEISAAGALGQAAEGNITLAITRKEDAIVELANSVENLHSMNDIGVDVYKAMAKVIFEQTGENVAETKAYLVEMTKDATTDGTKPGQAHGGSIVQSDTAGFGLMHFAPMKGATFFKIWVSTNPDPSIIADFVRTTPDTFPNSHGGLVAVATGVKLWFRIQACNAHGDGIMSAPFGGISFSATV
jgi:hypothetical protein